MFGVYDSRCSSPFLSPYENKIGGYPDFYEDCLLTSAPLCECCHAPLVLLIQIYCPLEGSPYHRLLHIFCCTQSACWTNSKSWLVLRSQYLDPSYTCKDGSENSSECQSKATASTDWCEDADNWGSADEEVHSNLRPQDHRVDSTLVHLEKMTISPPNKSTPPSLTCGATGPSAMTASHLPQYQGPCYASGYISAVEGCVVCSEETKVAWLLDKYHSENAPVRSGRSKGQGGRGVKSGGGGGSETYEKAVAKHGDRDFVKFQKELSKCPQQIVRYFWKGEPALMMDERHFEVPEESKLCCMCGAPRVFECQLMPALVYILQTKLCVKQEGSCLPNPGSMAVEFGTVIVYSCSSSCWEDDNNNIGSKTSKFKKELVIIQSEQ